jgi:seryl-tRNA(Sec) selenium transferase
MRCGKLTYAVLERTLELFLDEERVVKEHALFQLRMRPSPHSCVTTCCTRAAVVRGSTPSELPSR